MRPPGYSTPAASTSSSCPARQAGEQTPTKCSQPPRCRGRGPEAPTLRRSPRRRTTLRTPSSSPSKAPSRPRTSTWATRGTRRVRPGRITSGCRWLSVRGKSRLDPGASVEEERLTGRRQCEDGDPAVPRHVEGGRQHRCSLVPGSDEALRSQRRVCLSQSGQQGQDLNPEK